MVKSDGAVCRKKVFPGARRFLYKSEDICQIETGRWRLVSLTIETEAHIMTSLELPKEKQKVVKLMAENSELKYIAKTLPIH